MREAGAGVAVAGLVVVVLGALLTPPLRHAEGVALVVAGFVVAAVGGLLWASSVAAAAWSVRRRR